MKDRQIHPVVTALMNGGKIEEFAVERFVVVVEGDSDGKVCLGVRAVVNGITYRFTMLWLTLDGVRMAFRSELLGADDLANLTKHIIEQ